MSSSEKKNSLSLQHFDSAIRAALGALSRGDKANAERLALHAASLAPDHEASWLILASLADPEESLAYVKKALKIHPESLPAQQALKWALGRLGHQPTGAEGEQPPESFLEQIHPASSTTESTLTKVSPFVGELEQGLDQMEGASASIASPDETPPSSDQPPVSIKVRNKNLSFPGRLLRYVLFILVVAATLTGLMFLLPRFVSPAGKSSIVPPTPPCVSPVLTLGTATFQIQSIKPASDGSITIPSGSTDIAYWIEGTTSHYVFALSPTLNHPALQDTLKAGDPAIIKWGDCSLDEYVVDSVESGQPDMTTLLDQSTPGITIFIQATSGFESFMIRGVRYLPTAVEMPGSTVTPNPIQAEISFLDTTTSTDGKTLTLKIAINNVGANAFSISTSDISLAVDNAAPLMPLSMEPALPIEIRPGASETITITFSKPVGNTATFIILDFSIDIYF